MTEPESPAAPPSAVYPACAQPVAGLVVFDEAMTRALTRRVPKVLVQPAHPPPLSVFGFAVCKDDITTGLHAVVTTDVKVPTAGLTLDGALRTGHGPPGAQGMRRLAPLYLTERPWP